MLDSNSNQVQFKEVLGNFYLYCPIVICLLQNQFFTFLQQNCFVKTYCASTHKWWFGLAILLQHFTSGNYFKWAIFPHKLTCPTRIIPDQCHSLSSSATPTLAMVVEQHSYVFQFGCTTCSLLFPPLLFVMEDTCW